MIDRRHFLVAIVALPFSGLLHRRTDVFILPVHAWRALASAVLTARRVMIHQDVSAGSAGVMASLVSDCPGDLAYYRDLYFGMFEPTPALDTGRSWFSDPRRLERLCVFLRRGGCAVEQSDGWTVLSRRTL